MNKNYLLPAILTGVSVAVVANGAPATAQAAFTLTPSYVDTGNNNPILPTGQLSIGVSQLGTNQVRFTIANNGPSPSRIFEVMFGKGTNFSSLLSFSSLIDRDNNLALAFAVDPANAPGYLGVDFSPDTGNIKDPPGGAFQWESAFTALRDGASIYGIDPGQRLGVIFNLRSGVQFSQIQQGFDSGDLAVALHVGSLSNGGSDWYGTNKVTAKDIPEPFTMLGTGAALGFSALFQRQRNKRQSKASVKA